VRPKTAMFRARHLAVVLVAAGFSFLPFPPALRAAQDSWSDRDATQLMQLLTAGLVDHNPGKMLSAFDLARMSDGTLFEQNVLSFFNQTGTIRVHFNVLRTSSEGATGVADVAMEMEADMLDDRLPTLHKQAELHLVCEKSSAGWRIIDLTPRDFFSIQP
jgi:hypothetical protein